MLQGWIQQRNYEAKETAFLLLLLPVPSQLTLATICLLLRATFIDILQPARNCKHHPHPLPNPGPVITGFLGDRGKL
jgi:hypothetical protein